MPKILIDFDVNYFGLKKFSGQGGIKGDFCMYSVSFKNYYLKSVLESH